MDRCALTSFVTVSLLVAACGEDRGRHGGGVGGTDGGVGGTDGGGSADADVGDDAGDEMDAGDETDAGGELDAGDETDAGGEMDAGFDGGFDAGFDGGFDGGFDAGRDSGADAGTPTGDHLRINEICVTPSEGEAIEIFNPTASAVSLDTYYLSDNGGYHGIAAGDPWAPVGTAATDYLVRFPAGASIPAGGTYVIAAGSAFETTHGRCPDAFIATATLCGGRTIPAMRVPTGGGVGTPGMLVSNDREMVMLFTWSGTVGSNVRDVDYVTWGTTFDDATRVDKTAIGTYRPDTPRASQRNSSTHSAGSTISRCMAETGETATGGDGLTGHDETSENLAMSFAVATPTLGALNACP